MATQSRTNNPDVNTLPQNLGSLWGRLAACGGLVARLFPVREGITLMTDSKHKVPAQLHFLGGTDFSLCFRRETR
jgi:hypothetical protein